MPALRVRVLHQNIFLNAYISQGECDPGGSCGIWQTGGGCRSRRETSISTTAMEGGGEKDIWYLIFILISLQPRLKGPWLLYRSKDVDWKDRISQLDGTPSRLMRDRIPWLYPRTIERGRAVLNVEWLNKSQCLECSKIVLSIWTYKAFFNKYNDE